MSENTWLVTPGHVLNWKPDLSGMGHVSGFASKTELAVKSDMRVMSTEVWIVRVLNEFDDDVWSARIAGDWQIVEDAANRLLNTFCRRFPGAFLKYTIAKVV